MALAPGSKLGPYEVVALLGAGGMGEVYRARDTRLGREVALKVLPVAVSNDARPPCPRFEQEARADGRAEPSQHRRSVHDVGDQRTASSFYVSELVPGETLAAVARARPGSHQ